MDLIVDLSLSAHNPNNPTHTAGTTFFGQFMDHDMTFDLASPLGKPSTPQDYRNGRTPSFDLDSVYGAGPVGSPQLYDPDDRAKLKIESGGLFEDVPRMPDGTAIVADPRNDEHVIISGLQAAFLRFHNNVVDRLRTGGTLNEAETFSQARRLTTWHYQWLILNEFLPLFVGQPMVDTILRRGPRFYRPRKGEAFIPVEFQAAAYRFGHSMVRPSYRANLAGDDGKPFFALTFDVSKSGPDPDDLRGGSRAPRRFIGWQTFFDFGDGQVKPNKRIDTRLSSPLFHLPISAIASHSGPTALPVRTLLRQLTWHSRPARRSLGRWAFRLSLPPISTSSTAMGSGSSVRLRLGTTYSRRRSWSRMVFDSGRSAAGSSARSSSDCSRAIRLPTLPTTRAGGRRCRRVRAAIFAWSTFSPSPGSTRRAADSSGLQLVRGQGRGLVA